MIYKLLSVRFLFPIFFLSLSFSLTAESTIDGESTGAPASLFAGVPGVGTDVSTDGGNANGGRTESVCKPRQRGTRVGSVG